MPADRFFLDEATRTGAIRTPAAPTPGGPADASARPTPSAPAEVPATPAPAGKPDGSEGAPRPRAAADASCEVSAAGPEIGPASFLSESGGLLDSLMTGMDVGERSRMLGMISSSVEAEREAALDGRIRRQVDVGPRHRRRRESGQEPDPASAGAGPDDVSDPAERSRRADR